MSEQPAGSATHRLESWKAIAAHLNRDTRTVMRWEKTEELPVHRQRHLSRSSVYAFQHELDAWRANRRLEPPAALPGPSRFRPLAVAAMLAIGILSGGGGQFTGPLTARQAGPSDRVLAWPDEPSRAYDESMSPDGRYVAYVDSTVNDLAIRDLRNGRAHFLTRIGRAGGEVDQPIVSNDGNRVAFYAEGKNLASGLYVLPVDATEATVPQRVSEGITPRQWSADGQHILGTKGLDNGTVDIVLVALTTGVRRVLHNIPFPNHPDFVTLSPDGKYVAYDQRADPAHRQHDLWIVAVADDVAKPLLTGPTDDKAIAWSPDGRFIIYHSDRVGSRGNGLWALPMRSEGVAGDPILLRADFRGTPVTLTQAGTLFFTLGTDADDLLIAPLSVDGTRPIDAPESASHDPHALTVRPRWSGDGQWLLYTTLRAAGPMLTIRNLKTSAVTEVPLEFSYVSTFDVSPDGRKIVCRCADMLENVGIFTVDTSTGAVDQIVLWKNNVARQFVPQFTADGRALTYVVGDYHGHNTLVTRDMATGAERVVATLPSNSGNALRRSPDGRFVLTYLESAPPAQTTLRVFDVVAGQARDLFRVDRNAALTTEDGVQWMPDSKAVVANVRVAGENSRELWWIPVDGGPPHRLDVAVTNLVDSGIAIAPDAQHIAFVAGDPLPSRAAVLHYQFRLLERFLPTK